MLSTTGVIYTLKSGIAYILMNSNGTAICMVVAIFHNCYE